MDAFSSNLPASTRLTLDFAGARVLVLGDVMLDRYVKGEVKRVSPEGPHLVLRAAERRTVLGGAGNVANNIAALGGRAILIGGLGEDVCGHDLRSEGVEVPVGIDLRGVCLRGRRTTVKTRFMSGPHHLMRLDEESDGPIETEAAADVLRAYGAALHEADIVILSDYAKGILCDAVLADAIALARRAQIPVIVDPKRADLAAYRHATAITPNCLEVQAATGISVTCDASAERAALAALEASGADAVLLTRSEKGLTLAERGQAPLHLPAEARAVADVSGAGDTLVAVFALMLARGAARADAAQVANVAAGLVVAKPGTATVSQAELVAALHRQDFARLDEKILPAPVALARVAQWRAQGDRIGFTNGCFDLIHPDHVRLLQRARARCDRLVLGLNTDDSVRRLKGDGRPVQPEMARATVMASLAAVDLVVPFDEDTPMDLIEGLRPDVLFKGGDYHGANVVGREFVESYGGQVHLIPVDEGQGTMEILRRVAAV